MAQGAGSDAQRTSTWSDAPWQDAPSDAPWQDAPWQDAPDALRAGMPLPDAPDASRLDGLREGGAKAEVPEALRADAWLGLSPGHGAQSKARASVAAPWWDSRPSSRLGGGDPDVREREDTQAAQQRDAELTASRGAASPWDRPAAGLEQRSVVDSLVLWPALTEQKLTTALETRHTVEPSTYVHDQRGVGWPELLDDSAIWTVTAADSDHAQILRLEREQGGQSWNA